MSSSTSSSPDYSSFTRDDFAPDLPEGESIPPDDERDHGVDRDIGGFIASDPSKDEVVAFLNSATLAERISFLFGLEPFDYQRDLLDYLDRDDLDVRRSAIQPGRQVGKTLFGAALAADDAILEKGEDTMIAAPFQETADEMMRDAVGLLEEAEKRLNAVGLTVGCPPEDRNKREWEFDHGGRLLSRTLGVDGVGQRGKNPKFVIVDEAAFVGDKVFEDVIEPFFLTHPEYTFLLISTPAGDAGYYYERVEIDDDWYSPYWPSAISPLVDPEWLAEKQEKTEERSFKKEYLGQFLGSTDRFFKPDLVDAVTDSDAALRRDRLVSISADIARAGDDRTVIMGMDDRGIADVLVSDPTLNITEATGHLTRLYDETPAEEVVIDETGLGGGVVDMLGEEVPEYAVRGFKFTLEGKQSLYNALKVDMENGDIALAPHPRLRREMKKLQYSLTRGGKTKITHPDGGHDDHPDALALLADSYRAKGGSEDVLAFQL